MPFLIQYSGYPNLIRFTFNSQLVRVVKPLPCIDENSGAVNSSMVLVIKSLSIALEMNQ